MAYAAPVRAGMILEQATAPTLACTSKSDLVEAMGADRKSDHDDMDTARARASALTERLLLLGRCFTINPGQTALEHTELQDPKDESSGVTMLLTRSGHRFYSLGRSWRYLKSGPDYMQ
jgi:hypothetical protein